MYVKREKHSLVTCMTIVAEQSIKSAALEKGDEEILLKVRDQDLRAREARYHNHCRRNYTRNKTRHTSHEDSESSQSQATHISGFTNPFCSDVNPNELYCLSSGVPAKPDVADDLLKAPDIGRNPWNTL